MSLPTFVAAGAVASGTGTISVPLPAGIAVDDLLIMTVEYANGSNQVANFYTVDNTWTSFGLAFDTGANTGASNGVGAIYYKKVTSLPGSAASITATGTPDHAIARIVSYRGVEWRDGGSIPYFQAASNSGSGTTIAYPSITTLYRNSRILLINFRGNDSNTVTSSPPTNGNVSTITERIDNNTNAAGGGGFALSDGSVINTSTNIGLSTGTISATSNWGTATIALGGDRRIICSPASYNETFNDATLTKAGLARTLVANVGAFRLEANIPTAVFSDNFNRADAANLGANWTITQGGFTVTSNKVYGNVTDHPSVAIPTATYSSNHGTKITASGDFSDAFDFVGVGVRLSSGTTQDYINWTELDPTSVLSKNPTLVTISGMNALSGTGVHGVWYDGGTNWKTGDFWSSVGAVTVTSGSDTTARFIVAAVTDNNTSGANSSNENRPSIQIRWLNTATNKTLELVQYRNADNLTSTPIAIDSYQGPAVALNTPFYLEFERVGSVANCRIYSDASHLTLVDTLTINLTEVVSFRYFYVAGKSSTGATATVSATIGPVNFDTPQTGYVFRNDGYSDGYRTLLKLSYGNFVQIGAPALPIVSGDIIEVTAVGSLISTYINNVLKYSVVDTTYTSGKPGITYEWDDVRDVFIDDFYSWNIQDNVNILRNRAIIGDFRFYSITANSAGLIAIADSIDITVNPPAGYGLHIVTDISQAANTSCIYYNLSPAVAIGDQILYKTTTETNGNAVSISSTGIVSTVPSGSDTLKFRHWRPSTWSAELTFTTGVTARTLTADTQTYTEDLKPANLIVGRKLVAKVYADEQLFSDNFTGAAGVLGSNYTQQGDINIQRDGSGNVYASTQGRAIAWPNTVTFENDQYAEITITGIDIGVSGNSGLMLRTQTGVSPGIEQGHVFRTGNNGAEYLIGTYDTASNFNINVTSTVIPKVGDRLRASIIGNTQCFYVNDQLILTRNVSLYTSGVPAIYGFGSNGWKSDNFVAGNYGGLHLAGTYTNTRAARILVCASATYTLELKDAALTKATPNRTLVADTQTYNETLRDANLKVGKRLVADSQTYNETLRDANVKVGKRLVADTVTYNETLRDANVKVGKRLVADTVTYNETLRDANLKVGKRLVADTVTYNETLRDANLKVGKRLVADRRIYSISTSETTFRLGRRIIADKQTYVLTGIVASFKTAGSLIADVRSYTLIGNAAGTIRFAKLSAAATSYTFTGNAATLARGKKVVAETASYNETLQDATLRVTRKVTADTRSYTLTGQLTNVLRSRRLVADTQTYNENLQPANLKVGKRLVADTQTYNENLQPANLLKNSRLVSDVRSYALNGGDTTFRLTRRLAAEEFRANYIRNSMMVGTVAGTPGTAPNLWATFVPTWCTRTIVGTGIDSTTGLTYIDVALSGTNNSGATSSILLDPINSTTAPAGAGQTWVSSAYFGLLVGSWPTSAVSIGTVSRDGLGNGTGNQYISIKGVSGSSLQRVSATYTIVSSSARYIQTVIRFDLLANDSVNLTVRIAAPQLERGSVARTFIPTTNAVQYRWFELAGQSANLLENRRLTANTSSYTLTRNDATLKVTRRLVADTRSYALTGNNFFFSTAGRITANTSSYELTGNAVNLVRSRILILSSQSYTLVRNDTALKSSKRIIADKATYILTGRTANILAGERGPSDSRNFILTGNAANLTVTRKLISAVSSYTLTRNDANLKFGRKISLSLSSYVTSGTAANLLANRKIQLVRTFFDTNGYVEPGYTDPNYVSIDIGMRAARKLAAQVTNFNLNGIAVNVTRGGFIKVWTGSAWVSKPLKVWDGAAWVSKPLKIWDGTTWRIY